MKKVINEWFVNVPWGKIAFISWGDAHGDPVLLVHGRNDSAATFLPLLELLPDNYHYVGIDLPGHGKSDPFPTGVALMRLHFVPVIHMVVDHLSWKQFTYIGHSMGSEIGLFYHAIYPGLIKKFILLDPVLSIQRVVHDYPKFFEFFYVNYYNNYDKYNFDKRVYNKRRALDAVMKARGLTEKQAEIILTRNLIPIGQDEYKLSWDTRNQNLVPFSDINDLLLDILSTNLPLTLIIFAKDSKLVPMLAKRFVGLELFMALKKRSERIYCKQVDGGHDVHFTDPERLSEDICSFIAKDFINTKAKL